MSGPPLGRPPKDVSKEAKKQSREDGIIRNEIEGKFGVSKRRFSLNKVITKLPDTSSTAIAITFLVMNLSALYQREAICAFLYRFYHYFLVYLGSYPRGIDSNVTFSHFT